MTIKPETFTAVEAGLFNIIDVLQVTPQTLYEGDAVHEVFTYWERLYSLPPKEQERQGLVVTEICVLHEEDGGASKLIVKGYKIPA